MPIFLTCFKCGVLIGSLRELKSASNRDSNGLLSPSDCIWLLTWLLSLFAYDSSVEVPPLMDFFQSSKGNIKMAMQFPLSSLI
jgi:hypothetical protein